MRNMLLDTRTTDGYGVNHVGAHRNTTIILHG